MISPMLIYLDCIEAHTTKLYTCQYYLMKRKIKQKYNELT